MKTKYPLTRFMGSKRKLLPFIFNALSDFKYGSVLDAFSGSGCVAYEFKKHGKEVTTNDFLHSSYLLSKALVENNEYKIEEGLIDSLTELRKDAPRIVRDLYTDIFFTYDECYLLDSIWINIQERIQNPYLKALSISAVCRACQKKRPRGIFTYTGRKSWDGRKDLKMSMKEQFDRAVLELNDVVFDNGKLNRAEWGDVMNFKNTDFDLVYLDPPYWSPLSDNDYVRRYHFIEGYSLYWKNLKIDTRTKVRKFKSYKSPFSDLESSKQALLELFNRFSRSIIVLSYSSNGFPTKKELYSMLGTVKKKVDVFEEEYRYSFANQGGKSVEIKNEVKEYLIIGSG